MNKPPQFIIEPEFADYHTVRALFGLPRTTLYRLFNAGKIKASSLRISGDKSDKRLFNCKSIRKYLEENDAPAQAAPSQP